ncbi:MAG: hypothetical protein LLG08_07515 [Actinomycetia bacterium]|nr:hypothetical protein [Actinomycetes bacterium]
MSLLKVVATIAAVLAVAFFGLRAAVGTTGIGFPALDAFFVAQEWFVPSSVVLQDPVTVHIEGFAPGLTWNAARGNRQWLVSGSTLLAAEASANTYPVPPDGRVVVEYTFNAGATQQATGWRVVKIRQDDLGQPKTAAFVIVDLTDRVWLKHTGIFGWRRVAME